MVLSSAKKLRISLGGSEDSTNGTNLEKSDAKRIALGRSGGPHDGYLKGEYDGNALEILIGGNNLGTKLGPGSYNANLQYQKNIITTNDEPVRPLVWPFLKLRSIICRWNNAYTLSHPKQSNQ